MLLVSGSSPSSPCIMNRTNSLLLLLLIFSVSAGSCSGWPMPAAPRLARYTTNYDLPGTGSSSGDRGSGVVLCQVAAGAGDWTLCTPVASRRHHGKRAGSGLHLSVNSPLFDLHAQRKGHSAPLINKLSRMVQLRRTMSNLQDLG